LPWPLFFLYALVVVELSEDLTPSVTHSLFLSVSRLFHSDLLRTPEGMLRYDRIFRTLGGRVDYNAIVSTATFNYCLEFRVPASATRNVGSRVLRRKYIKDDPILELFPDSL
jgi:hypothetical protein